MRKLLAILVIFFSVLKARNIRESEIKTAGRYDYVVSLPDVHGDLDTLLRALWMTKTEIDGSESAGNFETFKSLFTEAITTENSEVKKLPPKQRVLLIQTGDIIDRGAASLSCYKAIWQVEKILGWDLVNLIGNHEVMTMAGEADNYAHPGDIAEFGSLKARRAAFAKGGPFWKTITDSFLFMVKVEMGSEESTLFVHAGLDAKWISQLKKNIVTISDLNEFLIAELKKNPSSNYLASASSPIWTRDLAQGSDKKVCNNALPKVLDLMKVTRMVVGHTPQQSLSTGVRCDAKLLLADVAMSRWMGSGKFGNPAAVIFRLKDDGNKLARIYNMYWKGAKEESVDQLIYQPSEHANPQEL